MQKAENHYSQRILHLNIERKKLERKLFILFLLRLVTFLVTLALFIVFLNTSIRWLMIAPIITFVLFLYLIKANADLLKNKRMLLNRIAINQDELNYLSYNYHEFDSGERYQPSNPELSGDFDIFGKGSLFQYINRSSTSLGKDTLASKLINWDKDENQIIQKQDAIAEITKKIDFLEDFQTAGKAILEKGDEINRILHWVEESSWIGKGIKILLWVYPLVVLAIIMFVIFSLVNATLLLLPIFFSFFLVNKYKNNIDKAHGKLSKSANILNQYSFLISIIEQEQFSSSYLAGISRVFICKKCDASTSLIKLFKLLEWFDIRFNLAASFLLNTLFLFDFQILNQLERWRKQHCHEIRHWFDAIAEIDSLIGFAKFAFNNSENLSKPTIQKNPMCMSAKGLGHPLIPLSKRVTNDIELLEQPKILVITGANMAGKSTFLRTLAINLILAQSGSLVCAKSFVFSPCNIVSSINVRDSLAQNESYFYAELLRIRKIIDQVSNNPQTLVVLDEILKGTNTKDKQKGTVGLLEKLIRLNAFAVIATHDLSIGEMENKYPDIVKNSCFEVELDNDQLVFDYKLKGGISTKLNASFLMRKMRIVD